MNARAPRILADQQAERRLAAQRLLTTPCAPEDDARPAPRRARQWPAPQPQDALDAACFAGFQHFTRERDPDKALARFSRLAPRAKQARIDEFLAMGRAFTASGGSF